MRRTSSTVRCMRSQIALLVGFRLVVDTSFIPSIFSKEKLIEDSLDKGSDVILIEEIGDIVLYSFKQTRAQDMKVSLFEKEE